MEFIRRLTAILHELDDIKVQDNCENAEAIKALKSVVYDIAKCLGDYIVDND